MGECGVSFPSRCWPCLLYPHHPASFPCLYTPSRTYPTPSDPAVQPDSIISIRLFSTYKDSSCKRFSLICQLPPALSDQAHCAQQSGFSVRHMLTEAPVPGRFLQVSSAQLVPNEASPGGLRSHHSSPASSPPGSTRLTTHQACVPRHGSVPQGLEDCTVRMSHEPTVNHSSQHSLGVPSCQVWTSGQTQPHDTSSARPELTLPSRQRKQLGQVCQVTSLPLLTGPPLHLCSSSQLEAPSDSDPQLTPPHPPHLYLLQEALCALLRTTLVPPHWGIPPAPCFYHSDLSRVCPHHFQ